MFLSCASSVLHLCSCCVVERALRPALRSIMRHIGSTSGDKSGSMTLITLIRSSGTPKPFCTYFFYLSCDALDEGRKCLLS